MSKEGKNWTHCSYNDAVGYDLHDRRFPAFPSFSSVTVGDRHDRADVCLV